jgi:hypothetical protein
VEEHIVLNDQIEPKRRIEQIREQVAPYREIGEIRKRLIPLSHHIKWAVTLQTNLIPNRYARERENQNEALANDFRWFSNRLNYCYYGKASRNKPEMYSLLLLPIVEGWTFSPNGERTLHFHVGVGNIPSGTKHTELRTKIHEAWLKTTHARDDIDMRPADSGFIDYIIKDLEKGCFEGFDLRGACIPHQALQFCP